MVPEGSKIVSPRLQALLGFVRSGVRELRIVLGRKTGFTQRDALPWKPASAVALAETSELLWPKTRAKYVSIGLPPALVRGTVTVTRRFAVSITTFPALTTTAVPSILLAAAVAIAAALAEVGCGAAPLVKVNAPASAAASAACCALVRAV